jgi:hypothetical protein
MQITNHAWLEWIPLVNTILLPLVGLGVHKLARIERRLIRHDHQLLQLKTVCRLTHPSRPDVAINNSP